MTYRIYALPSGDVVSENPDLGAALSHYMKHPSRPSSRGGIFLRAGLVVGAKGRPAALIAPPIRASLIDGPMAESMRKGMEGFEGPGVVCLTGKDLHQLDDNWESLIKHVRQLGRHDDDASEGTIITPVLYLRHPPLSE